MSNILDEILAHKRGEVEQARRRRPLEALQAMPGYQRPRRDFYAAVATPRGTRLNLIAEVKRASPSAGVIAATFDPVAVARRYEEAGAQALSVVTDEKFFDGRLEFIETIKAAVPLPALRKDFMLDPYQLHESRAFGADAILLIAEALPPPLLAELFQTARGLELCVLVEVHERESLDAVLRVLQPLPATGFLLGINNRNLKLQRIELETTETLAPLVSPAVPIVAESGLKTRADAQRMRAAGARALLIGETLMRSADPRAAVRELLD